MKPSPDEFVVKLTPGTGGWPCPRCSGMGTLPDGAVSMSPEEIRYTPPTKCPICQGVGRVELLPIGTRAAYAKALADAVALLTPCKTCGKPATRGYPTGEIGYYVYGCDEHRQGPEHDDDYDTHAFDMKQAALVRSLKEGAR